MAYGAVAQSEQDALLRNDSTSPSPPPAPAPLLASLAFQPLEMDFAIVGSGGLIMEQYEQPAPSTELNRVAPSIPARSDPESCDAQVAGDFPRGLSPPSPVVLSENKRARHHDMEPTHQSHAQATTFSGERSLHSMRCPSPSPMLRTASGRTIPLRHPTPDLHILQGALVAHVEHLEKTAEKLSMTSSIDDAIRQMHNEQKRSDSRRSSLLRSSVEMQANTRQSSSSGSVVDVNSAARSGGFSPGGYIITHRQSISASNRARSASKSSRFSSRPEPEREGRPLEFFENTTIPATSPILSRAASIAEQDEESLTLTRPLVDLADQAPERNRRSTDNKADRPTTSASTNTYEQAQIVFSDFDGEHIASQFKETTADMPAMSRLSRDGRPPMPRPQSYADPATGQQMVYYPAPVPMMLNLPQRLSKVPSKEVRNKRKSQVLNSIPPAARQSASWLPDVLEDEGDADPTSKDATETQEYVPQHHRRTIGGRQSMLDHQHMPPQLRAGTFFEKTGLNQKIEIKGESAVATLDSILDASAFAPVNAFTDHAFAGRLGSEVYGASNKRASKHMDKIPESDPSSKRLTKRKSFSTLLGLGGGDNGDSNGNEQRHSTMSSLNRGTDKGVEHEDDRNSATLSNVRFSSKVGVSSKGANENEPGDDEDDEGQGEDVYHGPPTTLLAELQLRKQHQQQRTRPVAATYPNGMRSTLLELDAVAQVEKNARKQKRVNLAWEDPGSRGLDDDGEDDEDVPLGILFPASAQAQQERTRPLGLMERRELEDNEPLSRRRDRLQGNPRAFQRASTMAGAVVSPPDDDDETLAQRMRRLKAQGGTTTGLPTARPVSGDFTSELMSQFGGEAMEAVQGNKGKAKQVSVTPASEEEETLGQRRKRLLAERAAREKEVGSGADAPEGRPVPTQRRSMADILNVHPAGGARRQSYNLDKPSAGLLGLHDQQSKRRSSAFAGVQNSAPGQRNSALVDFQDPQLQPASRANALLDSQNSHPMTGGFRNGMYNNGAGGMAQAQLPAHGHGAYEGAFTPPTYQPGMELGGYAQQQQMMYPFANPFTPMGYGGTGYAGYGGYAGLGGNGMAGGHNMMDPRMGMGYNVRANPMAASMLQMSDSGQALNQGQIDMVERWRQSVMQ